MVTKKIDPHAAYDKAVSDIEAGRYDRAEKTLTQALQQHPQIVPLLEALALLYSLTNRREEAIEGYRRALDLEPDNVRFHYFVGRLYHESGMQVEAMAALAAAVHHARNTLKTNPQDLECHRDLARIHALRGDHDKAVLAVYAGLTVAPDDSDLLRILVQEEYMLEHYLQVIRDVDAGLESHPEDAFLWLYRGLAWHKLNLLESALTDFAKALVLEPDQPEVKKLSRKLKSLRKKRGPTVEEQIIAGADAPRVGGVVRWFRDDGGIGYIRTDDERDVFIHYLGIEKQGYQLLREGQRVECGVIDSPQGLLATAVKEVSPPRLTGRVLSFDHEKGSGEVEAQDGRKGYFHFTSIIGTGVRLLAKNDHVEFELQDSDAGPQAINIVKTGESSEPAPRPTGETGTIAWFDKERGVGLITIGTMKAVFHREDVMKGEPRPGVTCHFRSAPMEALDDDSIRTAREIFID